MCTSIEWLNKNVYHTTVCDKHRRTLGNLCICGKNKAIQGVGNLLEQIKDGTQILKDVVNICHDYPCELGSLGILAAIEHWSEPKSIEREVIVMETAQEKSGLCTCCEKCPNRRINQNYCYNGKSLNECPAYSLPDSPSNEPPADIDNMLKS